MPTGMKQMSEVFDLIGKMGGAFGSAVGLYQFLTDTTATDRIIDAINEMDKEIVSELDLIAKEIALQTEYQEWNAFGEKIRSIQTSSLKIANEFATIKKGGNGYVIDQSTEVNFDLWATGGTDDSSTTGVLDQLYGDAQDLAALFIVGGVADPKAVKKWQDLYSAAKANNLPIFNGEHELSATFMLFQQVNGIISKIFFLHESILGMYALQYMKNTKYQSLSYTIKSLYGKYSLSNTVWGVFFDSMQFNDGAYTDFNVVSTSQGSWTGVNLEYATLAHPGEAKGSVIWTLPLTVYSLPIDKNYASNLFILDIRFSTAPKSTADFSYIYPVVRVGHMQAGGAIVELGEYHNCDFNSDTSNPNWMSFPVPGYANDDGFWYINTGYNAPQPVNPTNNQFQTVTGFDFKEVTHGPNTTYYDSYLTMNLYTGLLDVSSITNPKDTLKLKYHQTISTTGMGVCGYNGYDNRAYTPPPSIYFYNLNWGGNASTFPLDNIAFSRSNNVPPNTQNGNEVGFLMRSNFLLNKADFIQPTNSLVPHAYQPA